MSGKWGQGFLSASLLTISLNLHVLAHSELLVQFFVSNIFNSESRYLQYMKRNCSLIIPINTFKN